MNENQQGPPSKSPEAPAWVQRVRDAARMGHQLSLDAENLDKPAALEAGRFVVHADWVMLDALRGTRGPMEFGPQEVRPQVVPVMRIGQVNNYRTPDPDQDPEDAWMGTRTEVICHWWTPDAGRMTGAFIPEELIPIEHLFL